jgi:transcriptional regulator with XRE-family HTH domain
VSQQGDALLRQVLGPESARRLSFSESLTYLLQHAKSNRQVAKLIGVNESTVRRWRTGSQPKPDRRSTVERVVRALRTRPVTTTETDFTLRAFRPDRTRDRSISGRQLRLEYGTLDRVRQTWIDTGDSDRALFAFMSGIHEAWYRANLTPRKWWQDLEIDDDAVLDSDYGLSIA